MPASPGTEPKAVARGTPSVSLSVQPRQHVERVHRRPRPVPKLRDASLRLGEPVPQQTPRQPATELATHGWDSNPYAVRLVAAQEEQSAYERQTPRGTHGLLTEAFIGVLDELGDRLVPWGVVGELVRQRVQRICTEQRPDVEGPSLNEQTPAPEGWLLISWDILDEAVDVAVGRAEREQHAGITAADGEFRRRRNWPPRLMSSWAPRRHCGCGCFRRFSRSQLRRAELRCFFPWSC
jgi:hypothetical protein